MPDIVAIGGGGFLYGPRFQELDDHALRLVGKDRPRICFLPTPCGDHPEFVERFYRAFEGRGNLSHVGLFITQGTQGSPDRHLLEQDLIYVSSGNLVSAMAVWRAHGIDRILRAAWEGGIVLTGVSAGAVCWFERSITDSAVGASTPRGEAGLGFLPGMIAAHCNVLPEREAVLGEVVRRERTSGLAVDDGVALHYRGTALETVVSCTDHGSVRSYGGGG
jgi:peptidase E